MNNAGNNHVFSLQRMISVIVPLYNKGSLVCKTIDSVLKQDYNDLEIIVVDDGSKDDSAEYVKSYTDPRVRYLYKANGGVSSARNYGARHAKGEWLMYLDADDEILLGALSELMSLHEKYPECKLLTGQILWLAKGKEINKKKKKHISHPFKTSFPFLAIWLNKCYPGTRNMLVHKSLVKEYGGYDERMSFFEDWEFSLRMARCGSLACSDKNIGIYNQEEGGLSSSWHPLEKEMAYYIPEIIKKASFFERALLYENLEFELFCLKDDKEKYDFYMNMRNKYFSRIHDLVHWGRMKFVL